MQITLKFVCCSEYDFTDENGKRVCGVSCKCFDPNAQKLVKVKTNHLINAKFGDDITVELIPNGNYIDYVYAA